MDISTYTNQWGYCTACLKNDQLDATHCCGMQSAIKQKRPWFLRWLPVLALLMFVQQSMATQYWFAFWEDAPANSVKSFQTGGDIPEPWTEKSRTVDAEGNVRRLIFVEATSEEYAAGWSTFSGTKKAAAIQAANGTSADFENWSPSAKAFAKSASQEIELLRGMVKALAQEIPSVAIALTNAGYVPADFKHKSVLDWKAIIQENMSTPSTTTTVSATTTTTTTAGE